MCPPPVQRSVANSPGLAAMSLLDRMNCPPETLSHVDLIHDRSQTDHMLKTKRRSGPMQKLSERLNTFADAATLLMIIAFI
jgi:hypothetical protein